MSGLLTYLFTVSLGRLRLPIGHRCSFKAHELAEIHVDHSLAHADPPLMSDSQHVGDVKASATCSETRCALPFVAFGLERPL